MRRFKKTMAMIICLIMVLSSFAYADEAQLISASTKDYEGHWAQATIQKWMDEGRVSGYPDGSYKPDANVTRAEFVKLVNGIIDFNKKAEIKYEDVSASEWYYDYVGLAQEIGYISGYSADKFGPNDYITREQAASIISRIQYLSNNEAGTANYPDNDKISSWAKGSVGAASEAGFISGYNDGSFKPLNKLSRAEALTMVNNVLVNGKNYVVYNDGTELKDFVVEGDLIIAKTVGDGDVHLTNVEVKGNLYVYGGGENSLYFNNLKVNKIVVEKDKVRLVLGEGTNVEEIEVASEAVLENSDGTVAKVTLSGDNEVTLSGEFKEVAVAGNANIILKDAKVETLVAEKPIVIKGTGTIETLNANSDGITFEADVEIKKTVIGEGVTEEPALVDNSTGGAGGGAGGGGIGDGDVEEKSYAINLKVELNDESDSTKSKKLEYTTEEYSEGDIISEFMKDTIHEILYDESLESSLSSLLNSMNARLEYVTVNGNKVYSEEGWIKVTSYLEGTSYYDTSLYDETQYSGLGDIDLVEAVLDGIDINDLQNLDYTFKDNLQYVEDDLSIIRENLAGVQYNKTISFNNKPITYSVNIKGDTLDTNEEIANFILSDLTLSNKRIVNFFSEFGNTITIVFDTEGFNGLITINNKELIK